MTFHGGKNNGPQNAQRAHRGMSHETPSRSGFGTPAGLPPLSEIRSFLGRGQDTDTIDMLHSMADEDVIQQFKGVQSRYESESMADRRSRLKDDISNSMRDEVPYSRLQDAKNALASFDADHPRDPQTGRFIEK